MRYYGTYESEYEREEHGMGMAERRSSIVDFVNTEGSVTFAQIKRMFPDVSEMTLRTDLKSLDQTHEIIRVHGGAKSVGFAVGTDDLLARRTSRRCAEKLAIAQKAKDLITPGHTIFIDSGSTTTALASTMEDMELLVFTNSLTVASELAKLERVMTMVVGGRLNRYSMSTMGARPIEEVRRMTFDQVFLGATGYQRREGFSCGSDDEAVFKQTLVERSHKRIVLMDSSKEGRPSTFKFCSLRDVNTVVSDGSQSAEFSLACEDNGVKLL
ncbi:MAG: DeoR/GlpR family DNA-binding transcription regulator [Coriobacteriales bacterium]|nr:DeoR/GlpR family DNA-binding transcription regulator [Coriobacteriales bacterium]